MSKYFKTYEQMFDDLIEHGPETLPYCYYGNGIWKRTDIETMMHFFYYIDKKKWEYLKKLKETEFIAPIEKMMELNKGIINSKKIFDDE